MNKFLCIFFLLPTIFSCQNEKNLSNYALILEDIQFDKHFEYQDFKNCDSEKNYQRKNFTQFVCFKSKAHNKALENFEKQSKVYDFAENIFFKNKVSKIRNKDYLDLKSLALKSYDEGKNYERWIYASFQKSLQKADC